jgi:BASS family bile acid:Na+ symporter
MPGGQMSKLFTYLAHGNVALSITLTAAGTLGSLVTVPLLLELLAEEHLQQNNFEMPLGLVIGDVALYLLTPLLVGMTVGRLMPARRQLFSKICIRTGLFFVALVIVGSLGSGQIQPASYGWKVPLAIILFCVGAMQLSMLPFRVFGWSRADATAVGLEVTMRNMNLALLLKARLFPGADAVGNGVLFVILYYAGTALLAGTSFTFRHRRRAIRERLRQTQGEANHAH